MLMIHPYFAAKVNWEPVMSFAREYKKALLATRVRLDTLLPV